MHDVETVIRNLIEISEVAPAGGWRGWVAVRAAGKDQFSKSGWEKLLAEPEKLLEGAQQTLKSEGGNTVTVKYLDIGGRGTKAVIKRRHRSGGIRGIFRSMGAAHAIRNFIAAVKMKQYDLPVAAPLAAVYHKRFLFCDESIYISEYVEGTNLYEFLRNMQARGEERYWIMREVSGKMAEIFAELHKNNLWHRDAKATNFVVNQDNEGEYGVTITDVDGIKQYFSHSEDRQMQGLWQFAVSVMGLPGITRTDYLRMFEIYCDEVRIPDEGRGDIYRRLAQKAQAKYRLKRKTST
ncbi:MAG: lipopolysaccharide kinase InaA family protein [Sedimentisphaerales bacterium]|jgi:tRNA A-37 threonylcarbamoyl transferase component Bud32